MPQGLFEEGSTIQILDGQLTIKQDEQTKNGGQIVE